MQKAFFSTMLVESTQRPIAVDFSTIQFIKYGGMPDKDWLIEEICRPTEHSRLDWTVDNILFQLRSS